MKPTLFLLSACAPGYDRYLAVFLLTLFFLALSLLLSALPKKDRFCLLYAGVLAVLFIACSLLIADFLSVWTFFPGGIYTDFGLYANVYRLCLCTLLPMAVVFAGCKAALWLGFRKKTTPHSPDDAGKRHKAEDPS